MELAPEQDNHQDKEDSLPLHIFYNNTVYHYKYKAEWNLLQNIYSFKAFLPNRTRVYL